MFKISISTVLLWCDCQMAEDVSLNNSWFLNLKVFCFVLLFFSIEACFQKNVRKERK